MYFWLFVIVLGVALLIAKDVWQDYEPFKPWKEWIKEYLAGRWERWKSHSGLRQTYFVIGSVISLLLLGLLIFLLPKLIGRVDASIPFRDIALAFFATLSGLGILFGFYTSILRTETAQQGLITDRLNKAVEMLGKNDKDGAVIEVRLGALYALERIAQDSIRDHIQIIEILCAYIRHNSPIERDKNKKDPKCGKDIQAALTIIGRREKWPEGKKRIKKENEVGYRLDLTDSNLSGAKLSDANISGVNLGNTNLSNAVIMRTDFTGAMLDNTNIEDSLLVDLNMNKAWFSNTDLSNKNIFQADVRHAFFFWTRIYKGDLSLCKNLTQKQLDTIFLGYGVDIPSNLTRPKNLPEKPLSPEEFKEAYDEWRFKNPPKVPPEESLTQVYNPKQKRTKP